MTDGTVLITGASGGIGTAVAEEFGTEEWRTILCARSEGGLETTAAAVERAGGTPVVRTLDVREENDVFMALSETVESGLDVVIPAAGTMPHGPGERPLDEERYEDFRSVMDTNVYGLFAVVREALQFISPDGRVLVPSGSVAREPTEGMGAYPVSDARSIAGRRVRRCREPGRRGVTAGRARLRVVLRAPSPRSTPGPRSC